MFFYVLTVKNFYGKGAAVCGTQEK